MKPRNLNSTACHCQGPDSKLFLLFLLVVFIVSGNSSHAFASDPPAFRVIRGERPPLDFSAVDPGQMEPGVLLIKFSEKVEKHLDEGYPVQDKNGLVSFGLGELDELNARYGLQLAGHHFSDPREKNVFSDRHRAWGFHLWYRLKFEDHADMAKIASAYRALDQVELAEPRLKIVHAGSQMPARPEVKSEVPSPKDEKTVWQPNDPDFGKQWSLNNTGQSGGSPGADIDMLNAWAIEKGNPRVIVAIIDSGVDHTHPDLAPNMWEGVGYNFVDDRETIDPDDHGTQSAGIVAAVTNNNTGVAGIAGGDGNGNGVRLMSAQIFRPDHSEGGSHLALVWAADNGAAIAQNSWGHGAAFVYNQDVLDAIDYFNVNGGGEALKGGLVIFSAGNEGSVAPFYPAAYPGVIAVVATDHQDRKASYSNYGVWVDLTAPGGDIYVDPEQNILTTTVGDGYDYMNGTSAACPHVSGVAALLVSNAFGLLDRAAVWDFLLYSAADNLYANPGLEGSLGRGKLNAYAALLELRKSMEGVFNPGNFKATSESPGSILLTWNPNMHDDEVLIAMLPDSVFGGPEDGVIYSQGDPLPGGGKVVFTGKAIHHLLEDLEAGTKYRFGIWSVSQNLHYSSGRVASEVTLSCEPGSECQYLFELTGLGWIWDSNYIRVSQNGRTVDKLTQYCGNTASSHLVPLCAGVPFELELKASVSYMAVGLEVFGPAGNSVYRKNLDDGALDTLLFSGLADCSPLFCDMPDEISLGTVAQSSAEIIWHPGEDVNSWSIEWGTEGFKRGEGKLADGISGSIFFLDGLAPSTRYDFYVQAVCRENGESYWSRRQQFTTECEITALPYVENFDSEPEYKIPVCWEKTGKGEWWVDLMRGHALSVSQPKSLRLFHQQDSYAIAVLPAFDVPVNELILSFHTTSVYPSVYVGTISDPAGGESFTVYREITVEDTYGVPFPLKFEISFAEYEGADTRIAFRMGRDGIGSFGGIYLDDLEVRWALDCQEPMDIQVCSVSVESVSLCWKEATGVDAWEVRYGQPGFDPESEGTLVEDISENNLEIADLAPGKDYECYVRALCASGYSEWTGPYRFTTDCIAFELPFEESFVDLDPGKFPSCWTVLGTGSYLVETCEAFSVSPPLSLHVLLENDAEVTIVLPKLDDPPVGLSLAFKAMRMGEQGVAEVGILQDPADPDSFSLTEVIVLAEQGVFQEYVVVYPEKLQGHGLMALRFGNSRNQESYYLDEFYVSIAEQQDPTNIQKTADYSAIHVFPVPANSHMVVQSDKVIRNLRLINLQGQVVLSTAVTGSSKHLEVSGVPVGIYFLQVFSDEGLMVRPVSINR